jgi:hypothetical protein
VLIIWRKCHKPYPDFAEPPFGYRMGDLQDKRGYSKEKQGELLWRRNL